MDNKKKLNCKKVLVVSSHNPLISFEKIDLELLERHCKVKHICISGYGRFELGRLIPRLLWADAAYCWFADWHALRTIVWCKRLGKKSIIIVGGYDIANFPNIPYGIAATRPGALPMVQQTLELADVIVANSKFIKNETLENFDIISEKIQVIYHSVDSDRFSPDDSSIKEKLVLTVAFIDLSNIKRKHLDLFVRAAKAFPDYEFRVVGPCLDENALVKLQSMASSNVKFAGPKYGQDLLEAFQNAKVYVQISHHEGFGMALAEAMSCECIPVATNITALPEVVGDCGFYAEEGDLDSTVESIRKALKAPHSLGIAARERIVREFPLERREQAISTLVERLCLSNNH